MKKKVTEPDWVSPPELAKEWRVGPDKIAELIKSGELQAHNLATTRTGRPRYRISRLAVERFLRSRLAIPDGGLPATQRLRRKANPSVKEFF